VGISHQVKLLIYKYMKKAISVSLAKIDYDFGERYIEIIADCPRDYVFSGLNIDVDKLENNTFYKL
jgi:hypothetical protein